jgi:hypothetical protein
VQSLLQEWQVACSGGAGGDRCEACFEACFAGLAAAEGCKVVVLEARGRIGGRCWMHEADGLPAARTAGRSCRW